MVAGVLWATIISNFWWPFAARKELRIGLSESVMSDHQGMSNMADARSYIVLLLI